MTGSYTNGKRAPSGGPSRTEPIVVVCAADQRYVLPLAVMLQSLVANLDPERRLAVTVVDGGIPAQDRERLSGSFPADRVSIHWTTGRKSSLAGLPLWGRMPPTTYNRLMIPELLPASMGKAIWLDCDMVIKADLARLWNVDLGESALLAVQDMIVPYVSSRFGVAAYRRLGIPGHAKYFNAGVMVVDVDAWRRRGVARAAANYLKSNRGSVFFWDQEGLNAVLAGAWGELDPRWNQNASVCGQAFFKADHLSGNIYARVVQDPWIVHYNGNLKPWMVHNESPSRALYFHYLDMTPWAGWRPKRTVRTTLLGTYESSRVRSLIYPAEQWWLKLSRWWSRGASIEADVP